MKIILCILGIILLIPAYIIISYYVLKFYGVPNSVYFLFIFGTVFITISKYIENE